MALSRPGLKSMRILRNLRGNCETLDLAVVIHHEALRVAPGDAESHLELAYDLYAKGLGQEADAALAEGLRLDPTLAADTHANLYHMFKGQKSFAAAVAAYREQIRRAQRTRIIMRFSAISYTRTATLKRPLPPIGN